MLKNRASEEKSGTSTTPIPARNTAVAKFTRFKAFFERQETAPLPGKPITEGIGTAERKKAARVDKASVISYYLAVGSAIDIVSGLNAVGITFARGLSVAVNSTKIGKLYGIWREKVYRWAGTDERSTPFRKYVTELAAYEPFRTPVYTLSSLLGSFMMDGRPSISKALVGTGIFMVWGLANSILLGMWNDFVRGKFGVKPAAEASLEADAAPVPFLVRLLDKADNAAGRLAEGIRHLAIPAKLEKAALAFQVAAIAFYFGALAFAAGKVAITENPEDKEKINPIENVIEAGKSKETDIKYFMNAS